MSNNLKKESICIHGGYQRDETNAITLPIYQSSAYEFNDADHGANLFDLKEAGNIYSRLTNPTWDALGEKVNALEGGVGALVTSSGQAAITLAITNICTNGDHFIATQNIYGGSYALFKNTLKKFGIEVTFVNQNASLAELKEAIQENTKLIFAETIGNPRSNLLDFQKFGQLAKDSDLPLIIDNTFATPLLFNPLEHGAHIVVHSATKYLGGHGNALGGVIVDGGNYNFANGKFPEFTNPDASYHGLIYSETFGNLAYIVKARVQLIRDFGSTISPFNAFLIHTGLETLHLRIKAHSDNALALGQYLEQHPKVDWVSYPLLPSHKDYELGKKYLPKGGSGILSFGIKGSLEDGKKVINAFKLGIHAANVGDTRTIVSHPASTTHRQLNAEEQKKAEISPQLIRVSVGIENIEDIIADFENALKEI